MSKWKISFAAWKYLAANRPDTVLVPGYYNLPALTVALWGRLHRKRTVLMTESTESDHTRRYWLERVKSLLIRSLFSWCIAGGMPHVRYLRKLGFPESRIARRYDVVDNRFFANKRSERGSETRHTISGFPKIIFFLSDVWLKRRTSKVSWRLTEPTAKMAALGLWSLWATVLWAKVFATLPGIQAMSRTFILKA